MRDLKRLAIENRLGTVIADGQIVTDTRSGGTRIRVSVFPGDAEICRPDELVAVDVNNEDIFYTISSGELDFIKL